MTSDRLYRRTWLLFLLEGVERAGRSPIELKQLHALAYLANALSPCYGIESVDATVLKEKAGPLYPELIWDADRLVGMGLLSVSNLVVDEHAELRSACYSITTRGLGLTSSVAFRSDLLGTTARALQSVALAYARNPGSVLEQNLLQRDGNYADPHFGLGDVVDFGEWDPQNASANAVARIRKATNDHLAPSASVNLYAQYLALPEGG